MLTAVIVDDSPAESNLVKRILSETGVEVVGVSHTGDGGLELIRSLRPSLAMLDIMLPGLNGLEILAAIAAERIPTVPIMCTSMKMLKTKALAIGANSFVTKPYDDDITVAELQPLLAKLRAQHPP